MVKLQSLAVVIMFGSASTTADVSVLSVGGIGVMRERTVLTSDFQATSDVVQLSQNTVSDESGYITVKPAENRRGVDSRSDSGSFPSLLKLFGISLLWIPFNNWKKKQSIE